MDDMLAEVPEKLHGRFQEIVAATDAYCAANLDNDFRDICHRMAVAVCNTKLPVTSGKAAGWAAGIIAAVGYVNFVSDPSQPFHTPPADMAKRAGVSPAMMQSKSKAIRDALRVDRWDTRYTTQAMTERNPMKLLIPLTFLPPLAPQPPRAAKSKSAKAGGTQRVYEFDVTLVSGPVTQAFAKKNKTVSRTIEIRGDQTLETLHKAIFDAFDRDDPHMYEFQLGKQPMERDAPRYVMAFAVEDGDGGDDIAGRVEETAIDDLKLKDGAVFWYWFDFGDDWHHRVKLVSLTDGVGKGRYPRVTKLVGESPPQYVDWDEE